MLVLLSSAHACKILISYRFNACALTTTSGEMHVWEADSVSTTLTPDSYQSEGYSISEDSACGGMSHLTVALDRAMRMVVISTHPVSASCGECPTTSGKPSEVDAQYSNAQVDFSNIKLGPVGSTFAWSAGT